MRRLFLILAAVVGLVVADQAVKEIAAASFKCKAAKVEQDSAKIAAVQRGELKEARASWWGFYADDSTAQLQAALDSPAEKLIIDKQDSPWIVKPLRVKKSMEIIFESGAEIQAKKGEFKGLYDSLFNVVGIDNVTIRGLGKGGILRMLKPDYQDPKQYQLGEWRHTLCVDKVRNFLVENMSCLSSGGDGSSFFGI